MAYFSGFLYSLGCFLLRSKSGLGSPLILGSSAARGVFIWGVVGVSCGMTLSLLLEKCNQHQVLTLSPLSLLKTEHEERPERCQLFPEALKRSHGFHSISTACLAPAHLPEAK